MEFAPFNVRSLVNAVVSQVQRAAEEKNLEARERATTCNNTLPCRRTADALPTHCNFPPHFCCISFAIDWLAINC